MLFSENRFLKNLPSIEESIILGSLSRNDETLRFFSLGVQAADAAKREFSIGRMFPELLPCDGGTPCNITSGDLESWWEKNQKPEPG